MSTRARYARRSAAATLVALVTLGASACDAGSVVPGADDPPSSSPSGSTGSSAAPADDGAAATITESIEKGATDVPVSQVLTVTAADGTLDSVRVSSDAGDLSGDTDGATWTATGGLEPGASYAIKAVATGTDGERVVRRSSFTTQALTLAQQTYPSVAPLDGETVGVGMPVIVTFDVPVTDRASIEKHLSVTTTPAQVGTWHWLSDTEVHYRPKTYWQAGTQVSVDVGINGVDAGNGIYGQESRTVDFTVGDKHVYEVDAKTHQMKVFSNDQLVRTIPITTGQQPAYTTRSGTKVIIEKFESKTMNSETVGITGADAYNIEGVQYAMRLTYSGEFIHAAPWSVASQGNANVSHGCTGMSTENAKWLYDMTIRGDVVDYTGTDRPMTLDNGYGDWNESFRDYKAGSAIS